MGLRVKGQYIIYALKDPRYSNNFQKYYRYIGKTAYGLYRPYSHVTPASLRSEKNNYKSNWIKQLLSLGLMYEVEILETWDNEADLAEAEIWNIAFYRSMGCKLTNRTNGGDGVCGYKFSKDVVEKLRLTKIGKKPSKESNLKNSLTHGGIHPDKHKEIVDLYLSGKSSVDLAKLFKCAHSTITLTLKRNNIVLRKRGKKFDNSLPIEEKIRLYSHVNKPFTDQYGNYYRTLFEAAKELNFLSSSINNVLRGRVRALHGYQFKYIEETNTNKGVA